MILTMFEKAYEVAENSSVGDLIKAQMPDDIKKELDKYFQRTESK